MYINYLNIYQLWMLRAIQYHFGAAGRREAKMFKGFKKDYHKNYFVKEDQQKTKQIDLINAQIPVPLSQAYKGTKLYKLRHVIKRHPTQLNKQLKKLYNKAIDRSAIQYIPQLQNEIEDKTLKWKENMIMHDEIQKFNKILFKKKETIRLLEKEKIRPQNYLSQEILEQEGETEYLNLNKKFEEFKNNLNGLQNQRMSRMVQALQKGNEQEEDKIDAFHYLIQSQILNLGEEVKSQILLQIGWMMNEAQKSKSSSQELIVLDQTDEIVNELTAEIMKSVDSIVFDVESLKQFYKTFLKSNLESQLAMQQHIQSINAIQDYQQFLFTKFRDQDINLQHKDQKLQFSMLTQEQSMRYIKFNVQDQKILLKLVDTFNQYGSEKFTGEIASQMMQKLSVFQESAMERLETIGDGRFRILLRKVGSSLEELDDHHFASCVLAISLMHPSSLRELYPEVAGRLVKAMAGEIGRRMGQLSTDELAMVVRNLHAVPGLEGAEMQGAVMQEISDRVKEMEAGSVYQLESLIQYFTFCSGQLVVKYQWALNRMFDLLLKAVKESDTDFDRISALIVVRGLFCVQPQKATLLVQKYSHQMRRFIGKFQSEHLSPLLVLLSTLPVRREHELVVACKKRLVDINDLKERKQHQKDVANVVVSLARIDTKLLYGQSTPFHLVLALQLLYNRQLYPPRSLQYLPYSKMLKQICLNKRAFTPASLALILQGYTGLGYTNKEALLELVHHMAKFDPERLGEQSLNEELRLEEVGTLLVTYSKLQVKDECVRVLLRLFREVAERQEWVSTQAFVDYAMAVFHLDEFEDAQVERMLLLYVMPALGRASLDHAVLLLFLLSAFQLQGCETALHTLADRVNEAQLSELILEQRLLLNCAVLNKVDVKEKLLLTGTAFADFQKHQSERRRERLRHTFNERLTYEDTVQAVKDHLRKLHVPFECDVHLDSGGVPFATLDILLPDQRKAIILLSEDEMLRHHHQEAPNGSHRLLARMAYDLAGLQVSYLVCQQFLRIRDKGEDHSLQFLVKYYC